MPLDAAVMAFLAYCHEVLFIEEQRLIALVVLDVVGDWSVRLVALTYEGPTTAVPLAGVTIP
jgi:hypothetical protein